MIDLKILFCSPNVEILGLIKHQIYSNYEEDEEAGYQRAKNFGTEGEGKNPRHCCSYEACRIQEPYTSSLEEMVWRIRKHQEKVFEKSNAQFSASTLRSK